MYQSFVMLKNEQYLLIAHSLSGWFMHTKLPQYLGNRKKWRPEKYLCSSFFCFRRVIWGAGFATRQRKMKKRHVCAHEFISSQLRNLKIYEIKFFLKKKKKRGRKDLTFSLFVSLFFFASNSLIVHSVHLMPRLPSWVYCGSDGSG